MTDFLRGPVRVPDNRTMARARARTGEPTRSAATNIHDDTTAQKLGFRGGTIAGSIHMDQFPPVLMDAFGPEWFETGSLSLAFKNATISGDPVVAMVGVPPVKHDVQVEARMEQPDGTVVAEGTASVGTPSGTVRRRQPAPSPTISASSSPNSASSTRRAVRAKASLDSVSTSSRARAPTTPLPTDITPCALQLLAVLPSNSPPRVLTPASTWPVARDPDPDPVLVRRARLARLAADGQRLGYALLLVAVVAFFAGALTGFPSASIVIVVGALAVTTVVLLPAIVLGYAVRAAEKEERGEPFGH
jgi:hypothetical protein